MTKFEYVWNNSYNLEWMSSQVFSFANGSTMHIAINMQIIKDMYPYQEYSYVAQVDKIIDLAQKFVYEDGSLTNLEDACGFHRTFEKNKVNILVSAANKITWPIEIIAPKAHAISEGKLHCIYFCDLIRKHISGKQILDLMLKQQG